MAEHAHSTGSSAPLPLTLIDLETHPDGALLRLCGKMANLQDRFDRPGAGLDTALSKEYWATVDQITAIYPKTIDGFQMKAMMALAMLAPKVREVSRICNGKPGLWAGIVSLASDVIRGLPV